MMKRLRTRDAVKMFLDKIAQAAGMRYPDNLLVQGSDGGGKGGGVPFQHVAMMAVRSTSPAGDREGTSSSAAVTAEGTSSPAAVAEGSNEVELLND